MGNAFKEFDDFEADQNDKKPQEDARSLADIMREKREQTEKEIAGKQAQVESAEDRKRRLQANRDLLVK